MSTTLKRTVTHEVEIRLTGQDIAELFWELDAEAQAEFFNHLYRNKELPTQLCAVGRTTVLKPGGRAAMLLIGEYATPE